MGGQSYRCPECLKWFMTRAQLADHLRGKHKLGNFTIVGVATMTKVVTR